MTTPTAPTPEELAQQAFPNGCIRGRTLKLTDAVMADIRSATAAAIRQHSAPLEAECERLRIMADEPTTKRVWDGIQTMACLFADPDHMPTVLEFKAAFDAAFVIDGKPYDVERIKAEWQADYAAMEARATQAEDALAAMTKERDEAKTISDAYYDLVGDLMEATSTDNIADAVKAAVASQERERAMREALTGLADVLERDCGVEPCASSMAPAERYLGMARNLPAALQPKEPAHAR